MDTTAVRNHRFPPVVQRYESRDAILYALSLGCGTDPENAYQLHHVYERDLRVLPTFAQVMSLQGFWAGDPRFSIDWRRMVHGEQTLVLHRPLPTTATVCGQYAIDAIVDKGADRGAIVYVSRAVSDAASGEALATVRGTLFLRGDGGCGEFGEPHPSLPAVPDRSPSMCLSLPTSPQAALLYRLNGDLNPLHADPVIARSAGFQRPILHGLATMGMAYRLLEEAYPLTGDTPSVSVRFAGAVLPGETLRIEAFPEEGGLRFRAFAAERKTLVLDRGTITFSSAQTG